MTLRMKLQEIPGDGCEENGVQRTYCAFYDSHDPRCRKICYYARERMNGKPAGDMGNRHSRF